MRNTRFSTKGLKPVNIDRSWDLKEFRMSFDGSNRFGVKKLMSRWWQKGSSCFSPYNSFTMNSSIRVPNKMTTKTRTRSKMLIEFLTRLQGSRGIDEVPNSFVGHRHGHGDIQKVTCYIFLCSSYGRVCVAHQRRFAGQICALVTRRRPRYLHPPHKWRGEWFASLWTMKHCWGAGVFGWQITNGLLCQVQWLGHGAQVGWMQRGRIYRIDRWCIQYTTEGRCKRLPQWSWRRRWPNPHGSWLL